MTAAIKWELKRRSAVEPLIGHLKNERRLGRNYLKGKEGDQVNALILVAAYNFKLVLRCLRFLWAFIGQAFLYFIRACGCKNNFLFV